MGAHPEGAKGDAGASRRWFRCGATAGGNLCNASPAADSVPAMIAAGATVAVYGPNGRRELAVEDVPARPGKTNLEPGELITSIKLPARPAGSGDAYLRMTPRTEMDIAIVGLGVALTMDASGTVSAARVGLGAAAFAPLRAALPHAEALAKTVLGY